MAVIEEPQTTQVEEAVLVVTPSAVDVIKNLLEQRNIPGYALRVFVTGGGCSGLQYGMSFACCMLLAMPERSSHDEER